MTSTLTSDLAAVRQLIHNQLFPLDDSVTPETDLYDEGMDSIALMQLILLLEQEFGITLEPEDLDRDHFSTLSQLSHLIERKRTQTS